MLRLSREWRSLLRIFIAGKNWESKHPQKKIARYNILSL